MRKSNTIKFFADLPPRPDEAHLKLYKEAGFNYYILTEDYYSAVSQEYFDAISICEKMGLGVIIRGYDGAAFPTYFNQFEGKDLNQYSGIKGFYMIDEPHAGLFDDIRKIYVKWRNEKYPQKFWHINLFPSYATAEQLQTAASATKTAYEQYIDEYVDKVLAEVVGNKTIGFDHYPLIEKPEEGRYVSKTWLYDLIVVGQAAQRAKCEYSVCIQSFTDNGGWREIISTNDIRFQVYTSMAFGANAFEFFTYCTSAGLKFDAMVTNDVPTDVYYFVKEVIAELKLFERDYLAFSWNGATTYKGKNSQSIPEAFEKIESKTLQKLADISSVESAEDLIIGQFENDKKQNGYIVVSYYDPSVSKSNDVRLTFAAQDEITVYKAGKKSRIKLNKNTLKITLDAGEGLFIVV